MMSVRVIVFCIRTSINIRHLCVQAICWHLGFRVKWHEKNKDDHISTSFSEHALKD